MDHVLISSPSAGIGKTALALLVASAMDVGVLEVSGKMTVKDLQAAFKNMQPGDVLWIDEVHRLVDGGRKNAEPFLQILQDGKLVTPSGPIDIPDITVIAATTDLQKLDETIIGRFLVRPILVDYDEDEAIVIAAGHAKRLRFGQRPLPWGPDEEWLRVVARAANNNPRAMVEILTSLRDYALSADELPFNGRSYDLTVPLDWCGLTHDGLNVTAQAYLVTLAGAFEGVAGERSIAAALGERSGLLHTEKLCMSKGFLMITPQGRALTDTGWTRAAELMSDRHEGASDVTYA